MQILIVGTGYVGLVTGACLAEIGHTVTCLDINAKKIEQLQQGIIPIHEPGLKTIVEKNIAQSRLHFSTDYSSAVPSAKACFIAVPTPSGMDGSCNLSFVESAAYQIARHITAYCVLVNKSTVPIGTADRVKKIVLDCLKSEGRNVPFDVVSNPEFLKEGSAIQDCLQPDRIVIGFDHPQAADVLLDIYSPLALSSDRILLMDPKSAEMTKYAANAMLATRISFMNEMAQICETLGANINAVRLGIGSDARIGHRFLYPGVGYGGSCFPKDIRALICVAKQANLPSPLLEATNAVNENQKKIFNQRIVQYFAAKGGSQGKTVAIWGLSFKPNTDDIREAPALTLIHFLLQQGVRLRLFDPIAMKNMQHVLKDPSKNLQITWCTDPLHAAEGADAVALLTEWEDFSRIDLKILLQKMNGIALFDGRNQYDPQEMQRKGFDYISIGVPAHLQSSFQ